MNVTGWTIASRMKLPDYLFGNRTMIGVYKLNAGAGTSNWAISDIALPDPCCIWEFSYLSMFETTNNGWFRVGLANAVPNNIPEMDAATPLLPQYGTDVGGPRLVSLSSKVYSYVKMNLRIGMATGGKKLVIENRCNVAPTKIIIAVLVSSLPTKVPGWPGAWPAG